MHRRQKYVLNSEEESDQPSCFSCFCSQESEASECQLWVKTGKEESPYPLIGEFNVICRSTTGKEECPYPLIHVGEFCDTLSTCTGKEGIVPIHCQTGEFTFLHLFPTLVSILQKEEPLPSDI